MVLLLLTYCFIYLPLFVGVLYSVAVAVDLLLYVPPTVCGGSVFVFVLVCITLYPF